MKVFWMVLVLALLFVIGSASALRYFGKPPDKLSEKSNDTDGQNQ